MWSMSVLGKTIGNCTYEQASGSGEPANSLASLSRVKRPECMHPALKENKDVEALRCKFQAMSSLGSSALELVLRSAEGHGFRVSVWESRKVERARKDCKSMLNPLLFAGALSGSISGGPPSAGLVIEVPKPPCCPCPSLGLFGVLVGGRSPAVSARPATLALAASSWQPTSESRPAVQDQGML